MTASDPGRTGLPPDQRRLDVEGCWNMRDAGGWPTLDGGWMRTGRLYRSDDPIRLTEAGRAAIAALGLEAVVDLRQDAQVKRSPGFVDPAATYLLPVVDQVIDINNPPQFDHPADMEALYHDMIERGGPQLVRAVEAVAAHVEDGPVLVHCALGKDRTGLVVAMVQAAIGVAPASVVEEYALSDEPARQRYRHMLDNPLPDDPPIHRAPPGLWSAPAETMAGLTEAVIAHHGSLEAWVRAMGLTDAAIERLRTALVVDG